VMQLEAEVDRLRMENDDLRRATAHAMAEAERRPPRRDLVPLRQEVDLFSPLPSSGTTL
jgi:hypothetical protein